MEQIYLCGPVSGRPKEEAFKHFERIENKIIKSTQGTDLKFFIHNPMKFVPADINSWTEEMKICVAALTVCDGIALLKGWQKSKGANIELKLAQELQIPVVYVEDFERQADFYPLYNSAPELFSFYDRKFDKEGSDEGDFDKQTAREFESRYLDPNGFEFIETTQEIKNENS